MFLGIAHGPMGSGKSSYLYDKYRAYKKSYSNILAITHSYDTRKDGSICTHTCMSIPAIKTKDLMSIDIGGYNVLLIDEAQFFPDLYEFISSQKKNDIHIFVAGLNGDFNQHKFGQILDIIPMSSECIHRTSICDICGKNAPFTLKREEETNDQVDPGGFDKYYTVCNDHIIMFRPTSNG